MKSERRENNIFFILFYFFFAITHFTRSESEEKMIPSIKPSSCAINKNEYFHIDLFKCIKCPNDLVTSDNGFGCVCNKSSKIVALKEEYPSCISCEAGKVPTEDGTDCISCKNETCRCPPHVITIERNWDGTLLEKKQCFPCPKNTYPSVDGNRCLPCDGEMIFQDYSENEFPRERFENLFSTHCPLHNFPKDWPDVRNTYTIEFNNKVISIDSYYFRTELKFAYYFCEVGNRKACAQLANMCALTLFKLDNLACKIFTKKMEQNYSVKLFYRKGEAKNFLTSRTIDQQFTLDRNDLQNNRMKLIAAKFGLRGNLETISEPSLLCPFFSYLPFGVNLSKKCKIPAIELIHSRMEFFVPFLSHFEKKNAEQNLLHPLPIFIKNINKHFDPNDLSSWKLVGRFFSIDKITGRRAITNSKNSNFTMEPEIKVLRYLKSLHMVVKLQGRNERGKIFPPLLVLEYDELTDSEIMKNVEVVIEYKVTFNFADEETNSTNEIFIGIFTSLGIIFSAIKTWSYSRRSCKNLTNISTIIWFIIYCLGVIGNILLIISSCSSIYIFAFYKGQKVVHILLPNEINEWSIKVCTIIAFSFKAIEVSSLLYQQRKVNIFFIDWEQPKIISRVISPSENILPKLSQDLRQLNSSNGKSTNVLTSEIIGARRKKKLSSSSKTAGQASTSGSRESINLSIERPNDFQKSPTVYSERDFSIDEQIANDDNNYSVSIWRTCLVANEWLKIKTARKRNILLQIIVTLFILEILGLKYWSKAIPDITIKLDEISLVDESFTLKYAVGVFVYLIVYTVQWFFTDFIYQRYIKNHLQEFVDLCSMANISVFILSQDFYGYYIHGRSVHGFADTDLLTLIKYLKREENNLCAHRGLMPGTTEQTFVISVSKTFRTFYDRILGSQNPGNDKFLRRNISSFRTDWDERWRIYLRLKNFFTGFIDHCYKNVDYTIKEKHCFEKMCDLEMTEPEEKSIFYIDNTYSFDRTIFYGNEWTLATLEINIFLLVLVFDGNYIIASFAALIAAKVIATIAKFRARKLLAERTFVDERFLVST